MRDLLRFTIIVFLAGLLGGQTFYALPVDSESMEKCGQSHIHHFTKHDGDSADEFDRPQKPAPGSDKKDLCCHMGDYIGPYRLLQSTHIAESMMSGKTLIIFLKSRTPTPYYPVEVSPG